MHFHFQPMVQLSVFFLFSLGCWLACVGLCWLVSRFQSTYAHRFDRIISTIICCARTEMDICSIQSCVGYPPIWPRLYSLTLCTHSRSVLCKYTWNRRHVVYRRREDKYAPMKWTITCVWQVRIVQFMYNALDSIECVSVLYSPSPISGSDSLIHLIRWWCLVSCACVCRVNTIKMPFPFCCCRSNVDNVIKSIPKQNRICRTPLVDKSVTYVGHESRIHTCVACVSGHCCHYWR